MDNWHPFKIKYTNIHIILFVRNINKHSMDALISYIILRTNKIFNYLFNQLIKRSYNFFLPVYIWKPQDLLVILCPVNLLNILYSSWIYLVYKVNNSISREMPFCHFLFCSCLFCFIFLNTCGKNVSISVKIIIIGMFIAFLIYIRKTEIIYVKPY